MNKVGAGACLGVVSLVCSAGLRRGGGEAQPRPQGAGPATLDCLLAATLNCPVSPVSLSPQGAGASRPSSHPGPCLLARALPRPQGAPHPEHTHAAAVTDRAPTHRLD